MVRLSDAGWRIPRIAIHLNQHEQTVRYWIKAFLKAASRLWTTNRAAEAALWIVAWRSVGGSCRKRGSMGVAIKAWTRPSIKWLARRSTLVYKGERRPRHWNGARAVHLGEARTSGPSRSSMTHKKLVCISRITMAGHRAPSPHNICAGNCHLERRIFCAMKKATVGILRRACSLMALVAAATVGVAQTPLRPRIRRRPPRRVRIRHPLCTPDEISYAFGLIFGTQLHGASITTEVVPESITRGIRDALWREAGRVPRTSNRYRRSCVPWARRWRRNQTAAKDFLARNGQEKRRVTTASGLQYGKFLPLATKAPAHCRWRHGDRGLSRQARRNGIRQLCRAAYRRGFPVNGVIKGWQEALALMKPGAKWQLFVPPEPGVWRARSRAKVPGELAVDLRGERASAPNPAAVRAQIAARHAAQGAAGHAAHTCRLPKR